MSHSLKGLTVAWTLVERQWQQTRAQWRDSVAIEFERRSWKEIEERTRELRTAAARLEETLDQALRSAD